MAGAIRYCTSSDGTRIAYGIDGDGPALIELGAAWESALTGEMKWARDAYAPVRHGRTVVYGLGMVSHRTRSSHADERIDVFRHAPNDAFRRTRATNYQRAQSRVD